MKRWLLLLLFSGYVLAQNTSTIGVLPDNGATLPPTCAIGQIYFKTAAPIGLNQCNPANTWTALATAAGSGTVSANSGTAGAVAFYAAAGGSTTVSADQTLIDNGTAWVGTEFFRILDGAAATPAYSFSGATGTGFHRATTNLVADIGGVAQAAFNSATGFEIASGNWIAWSSSSDPTGAQDTTISRSAGKSFFFGAGGDATGNITTAAYKTGTNCSAVGTAASPSVASCGSASAGSFSCATNAVNTCTVNTTAVTANSEIFLSQREDTTTGTRLGVTCNTSPSTIVADENITAVIAGTSFSFSLTQPVTNPNCYSYFIIN